MLQDKYKRKCMCNCFLIYNTPEPHKNCLCIFRAVVYRFYRFNNSKIIDIAFDTISPYCKTTTSHFSSLLLVHSTIFISIQLHHIVSPYIFPPVRLWRQLFYIWSLQTITFFSNIKFSLLRDQ